MSVLITGGLGHVGSWIAYNLAEQGESVIIYDISVKQFDYLHLDYLETVRDKLIFEEGDVLDFRTTVEVVNRHKENIDGIIHTAALGAIPEFKERPHKNISLNTIGTLNMLEVSRIFGVDRFVYTSSGAVYGDAPGPLQEAEPYKATDLYAATKISSELLTLNYSDTYNIDCRIARLYFVYGPGKFPSKMHGLHKGLFGPLEGVDNYESSKGGETYVDFTHVKDVADGVTKLYKLNKIENKIFNITSGRGVTVKEIIHNVKAILGRDTGVKFGLGTWLKRGAPLDISRAKRELGYNPKFTNIQDGIVDYLKWIQKNV